MGLNIKTTTNVKHIHRHHQKKIAEFRDLKKIRFRYNFAAFIRRRRCPSVSDLWQHTRTTTRTKNFFYFVFLLFGRSFDEYINLKDGKSGNG